MRLLNTYHASTSHFMIVSLEICILFISCLGIAVEFLASMFIYFDPLDFPGWGFYQYVYFGYSILWALLQLRNCGEISCFLRLLHPCSLTGYSFHCHWQNWKKFYKFWSRMDTYLNKQEHVFFLFHWFWATSLLLFSIFFFPYPPHPPPPFPS